MAPLMRPLPAVLAICAAACAGGISVRGTGRLITADDGARVATYELTSDPPPQVPAPPRGVLFYVTGSENETVQPLVGRFAGAVEAGLRVVLAERRGVGFDGKVKREVALAGSAKARRVADQRAVLDAYLKGVAPGTPVVLVGASEGGDVAAAVAAQDSRVTHLVLLGCGGGWSQAQELRFLIERDKEYIGLHNRDELEAAFARIRADPDGLDLWAGHPFRRWSTFLWSPPVDDLLKTRIPVFLAHGAADRNVPVESARALADAYWARAREGLTYREYANVDHHFADPTTGVSQFPRLEVDLAKWFAATGLWTEAEAAALEARTRLAHPDCFRAEPPPKEVR